MNLLSIDSSSSVLSVAVSCGDNIYYTETDAGMKHSELIMDCIACQMEKAFIKPCDLNGVLCMGGPGSFTGLRIGYSIAKGLCLSLSIPFAPVPTLDCIAESVIKNEDTDLVLAVIEARKNAYFYSFFKRGQKITADNDADSMQMTTEIEEYIKKLKKISLTGPGSDIFYNSLPDYLKESIILKKKTMGYAKEIISIAKSRKILDNDNTVYLYSGPEYLRKTDAEIALKQGF